MCAYQTDRHTFLYCPGLTEYQFVDHHEIDNACQHSCKKIAQNEMMRHKPLKYNHQEKPYAEHPKIGNIVHTHTAKKFSRASSYPIIPYQEPAKRESDNYGTLK